MPSPIKFELLGNWALTQKIIKELPGDVKESYRQAQRSFGKKLERKVKRHLRNQDLPWKELAESTVKRKKSQEILIETSDYYNAIRTYSSGPYTISVGVKEGVYKLRGKGENESKISIADYAAIHERGHVFENGRVVPKRPLWVPTWKEMGGKEGMANEVIDAVNKVLARKGISQYFEVGKKKTNFI